MPLCAYCFHEGMEQRVLRVPDCDAGHGRDAMSPLEDREEAGGQRGEGGRRGGGWR